MAQKKLQRFAEIKTFSNVLEYPENMPGKWNVFFKNEHPIIVELGCGKGEYTVALAKLFTNKNFIGVDIKGNRIWAGAKNALENKLHNAAFLRTQIEMIEKYFSPKNVQNLPFFQQELQFFNKKCQFFTNFCQNYQFLANISTFLVIFLTNFWKIELQYCPTPKPTQW